ncbi:MAG: epoxyqueuosine reductase QueH [Deltaproteobacteria bacterium]
MKLLLHICCAPCTIYPLSLLISNAYNVTGFFSNPNIHPFVEYEKRRITLQQFAQNIALDVIYEQGYPLEDFFRAVSFNETNRCEHCYRLRLEKTAIFAQQHGYQSFSTTLLYSKYQKHELIKTICEQLAQDYCIEFVYEDFRVGWQKGVDESRKQGMYRQKYCGCIYSISK